MESQSEKVFGFLDPDVALSLATIPTIVAIVGGHAIAEALTELGVMSEELFRGDRLPAIDPPD